MANCNDMNRKLAELKIRALLRITAGMEAERRNCKPFLNSDRKKRLRQFVRRIPPRAPTHEEWRERTIRQRCGSPLHVDPLMSDPDLRYICVQYQDRIRVIENDKYDIELEAKCTRQKLDDLLALEDKTTFFYKKKLKKAEMNNRNPGVDWQISKIREARINLKPITK